MSTRPLARPFLLVPVLLALVGAALAQDRSFDDAEAHDDVPPPPRVGVAAPQDAEEDPAQTPADPASAAPATEPATEPASPPVAPGDPAPAAPADTSANDTAPDADDEYGAPGSPREAVRAYLSACRAGDYERAATFLDMRLLPRSRRDEGPRLAWRLKVVIDRVAWIHLGELSGAPEGVPPERDGLAADQELLLRIPETRNGAVNLVLERVRDPDGSPDDREWLFSASTVRRIDVLYAEFGYGPLGELLPETFKETRFLEVALFQWIGLLALVLVGWVGGTVIGFLLLKLVGRFVRQTETEADDQVLGLAAAPITWTLTILILKGGSRILALSKPAQEVLDGLCNGLIVVSLTWLAARLVDLIAELMRERMIRRGAVSATTVIPMGRRLAKVFLILIALLSVLSNLGVNITGLIAGLGVGGLAVALAAQKTFENFFGGISVIVDRPVRVGDFCRFGDKVGTVEDIGLRSTRVRTLDRTLITIPNAEFSSLQLENITRRDRIRFTTTIGLRYETTADQLRYVLVELKKLLLAHPKVSEEPCRVRFSGFGASSLDVEVFLYVVTTDWETFTAVREQLMLEIMDLVERAGTGFAFPSQTLYLGRDDGLAAERAREAERAVAEWRERGELDLPYLPAERAREVRGRAPWPPEGSSSSG